MDKLLDKLFAFSNSLIYLVIALGVVGGITYISDTSRLDGKIVWLTLMWWYVIANKFNDYKRR